MSNYKIENNKIFKEIQKKNSFWKEYSLLINLYHYYKNDKKTFLNNKYSNFSKLGKIFDTTISNNDDALEKLIELINKIIDFRSVEFNNNTPFYGDPIKVNFNASTRGGETNAQKTITELSYKNTDNLILKSNDNSFTMTFINEKNTKTHNNFNYFSSGANTAIYIVTVNGDHIKHEYYKNVPLILRLLPYNDDNFFTNLIKKYKENISKEFIKNHIIDILYYGTININSKKFSYMIVPQYDTTILLNNKLSFSQKKTYITSVIEFLNNLSKNNLVINDFKLANISINSKGEIIVIDYDHNTISENFNNSSEYKPNQEFNGIKKYNISLAQIIYQLFILGKYENVEQITIKFDEIFIEKQENKKIINPNFNMNTYKDIIKKIMYDGIKEILFDDESYGLINSDEDAIPDYEKLIQLINQIIEKPINYKINDNSQCLYKSIIHHGKGEIGIDEYATIRNNFVNKRITDLNKKTYHHYDKAKLILYYIKKNNWKIIYYNSAEDVKDDTLKYALQAVGAIYSVSFNIDGPEFILHINKDFTDKYGCFYDNCRVIDKDDLLSLLSWIVNITDMFNMLFVKRKSELLCLKDKKSYYINIFDHPIVRSEILSDIFTHPYDHIKNKTTEQKIEITVKPDKIYCWSGKKDYEDTCLPFPDIWMFLLGREFSKDFNIKSYKKFYTKTNLNEDYLNKKPKGLFRGSFTNCVGDDKKLLSTPRIKAHIKTLQNKEKVLDAYITGTTYYYTYYSQRIIKPKNIDYFGSEEKFMKPTEQIKYKVILNLDGFASAWRIIQELYYNSCIIIPESDYTDVIRNCLKKWVHYVPCKADLSNLINTIKWCTDKNNNKKILQILKNLRELRDKIISLDNMLDFTFEKMNNPLNTKTLAEYISFDEECCIESKPDEDIHNDEESLLGKTGTLSFIDKDGKETLKEEIHYNKYLKYKQKYITLKQKN